MKKIVVYPGRFQPMLKHHAEVYAQLQRSFPDADVYIGTSNKTDAGKSPFSFEEKKKIMSSGHGIPADKIIQVTNPYSKDEYPFDQENTTLIFAVGEKDLNRMPTNNVDPESGLNMLKGGERASYLQNADRLTSGEAEPMSTRGYVTLAPTIKNGEEDASASAFRQALVNAPDTESAKELFTRQFGQYNDEVFNLIYDKIVRAKMSEQLNILRKLAGLAEAAPVQFKTDPEAYGYEPQDPGPAFDTDKDPERYDKKQHKVGDKTWDTISPKDAKNAAERPEKAAGSDPVSAQFIAFDPEKFGTKHQKMSVANRMQGADAGDMEQKKDRFFKELMSAPKGILGEINSRLANDDNSLAVSDRLSNIISGMPSAGVGALNDEDKTFIIQILANAVKNMDLGEPTNEPEEDDMAEESVDLSDIRDDYGIEEKIQDQVCPECDGSGCEACDDVGGDISEGGGDAPDEQLDQAVSETVENAMTAALAELRKLAGI
jgi:hypothetical protein